jgi:hypothetical protein
MKSRGLQWVEHMPRMVERRNAYQILVGKFLKNLHLENHERDGTT